MPAPSARLKRPPLCPIMPVRVFTGGMVANGLTDQRWILRRRMRDAFVDDVRAIAPDPVLAHVLYARHYDTPDKAQAFLYPEGPLADADQLADVPRAVDRLRRALQDREEIVVYGDFDADGVCATALLVHALRQAGAQSVAPFVPDRFTDGYGLTRGAFDALRSRHPAASLVITVDCGIRSPDEVAYAHSQGVDMIITDHHSLAHDGGEAELPEAVAVINPKRPDSRYPFHDLAGVGVAYRLVEALFAALGPGAPAAEDYLDLVALGTIADVVPLLGENRLLVRWGLQRMRSQPRPGLRALLDVAGLAPEKVSSSDCAFRLGPRINAAGRLDSAVLAYDLLLADDMESAAPLASQLDSINQERQTLLADQIAAAQQHLGDIDGRRILIVDLEDLHEGVVGLVASRLVDHYHRPAVVIKRGAESSRGSARSIEGFSIIAALDAYSALFERHGGHDRAAGFTLSTDNLDALHTALTRYADEHIADELLSPRHSVDAIIPLTWITEETPATLARLGPFGEGNPQPALATLGLTVKIVQPVGRERQHLRLQVSDGQRVLTAIAFRQGQLANTLCVGDRIDLIYRPDINEWRGETDLQLVVQAIRPSRGA